MKSNSCALNFLLEASARKYFRLLIDAAGDQATKIISLFFKPSLTTILNFKLSRLPSDCIFHYTHSCMGSLDPTSLSTLL